MDSKDDRLKVACVVEEGRLGGPQIRIAEIAGRLAKNGIANTVYFPKNDSCKLMHLLVENHVQHKPIKLHKLSRSWVSVVTYLLTFPFEVASLLIDFKKNNINIVHSGGGAWQYKAVVAGRLAGAKVLWHLNDTSTPRLLKMVYAILSRIFVDGVIVEGHRVRLNYINYTPKAVPVFEIQSSVDTKYFDKECVNIGTEIKKSDALNLFSCGNISPVKGLENLIEALNLLNDWGINIALYIAGDMFSSQDNYVMKLRSLIKDVDYLKIKLLGAVDDVRPLLKAADIYVCSSVSEASPLSVWEAMSMAKPIVSTDVGDISRFIVDGKSGYIVPVGDPVTMAKKIEELADKPELGKKFGKRAREIAQEYLDTRIIARYYERCYRDILSKY